MAQPSKGMDLATLNAIHEWMKQGNVVSKPRCKHKSHKLLQHDTWRGSKVTVGFKMKELADG